MEPYEQHVVVAKKNGQDAVVVTEAVVRICRGDWCLDGTEEEVHWEDVAVEDGPEPRENAEVQPSCYAALLENVDDSAVGVVVPPKTAEAVVVVVAAAVVAVAVVVVVAAAVAQPAKETAVDLLESVELRLII